MEETHDESEGYCCLSRWNYLLQLLYLTKKFMHWKTTTLRLLLILRWIKLLLTSLGRPENDGNVLANVIEASFDNVDLHEVIGDQDSEARGTCGWRVHCCFHRLQINLTLVQGLLAVIFWRVGYDRRFRRDEIRTESWLQLEGAVQELQCTGVQGEGEADRSIPASLNKSLWASSLGLEDDWLLCSYS